MDGWDELVDDTGRACVAFLAAALDGDDAGKHVILATMPPDVLIGGLAGVALGLFEELAEKDGYYGDEADAVVRDRLAGILAALPQA